MINKEQLEEKIEKAGMRVKFREPDMAPARWGLPRRVASGRGGTFRVDVERDKKGEYFEITATEETNALNVLDVVPEHRHLLLHDPQTGRKLLLGHDERHLYVSEVNSNARNVVDAIIRLAPAGLHNVIRGRKKAHKHVFDRITARFVRQGEWFFVPEPDLVVDEALVIHNEPLQRNAQSKPHRCQDMYRSGGETVYIGSDKKTASSREFSVEEWEENQKSDNPYHLIRQAVRGAGVYVRGWVRHEDHSTVVLKTWHRVEINSEMTSGLVGFLD
jgi:hypothetical protein